jgi:endonuclease/exonuclease/phosphatase family metal-dependent hydrolase
MPRFTILTYNTLHGLETTEWSVRAGESAQAHETRLARQFEQLARVQPEVILLQEVNPLPAMAEMYVSGLKHFGLDYSEVHQVDACGIRLAPRLAVAPMLNNGLAILVKAPLRVRKLKGLKLSGGAGGCGDSMGFQTGELRYALLAEVENPDTGRRMVAVSLHLHSGIERNHFFIRRLAEAEEQGRISRKDLEELVAALERDETRRLEEVRVLLAELQRLERQGDYMGVILGGDFNFEPGAPEYQELERAGLRDSYVVSGRPDALHSYDPRRNAYAAASTEIPPALHEAVKRLPEFQRQQVLDGYRNGVREARRIDFLFLMRYTGERLSGCLRQELFGVPASVSLEPGSDHYGVLNTYIADPAQC